MGLVHRGQRDECDTDAAEKTALREKAKQDRYQQIQDCATRAKSKHKYENKRLFRYSKGI